MNREVESTRHVYAGRTVLLAEDEEMVRSVMSNYLQRMGLKVLQAADGKQALEALQRGSIDLAIIDCRMPLMSGYAVLEEMRLITPDLPVVMISGDDRKYVMGRFGPVRPDEVLLKPVLLSTLRETVSKWIRPPEKRTCFFACGEEETDKRSATQECRQIN